MLLDTSIPMLSGVEDEQSSLATAIEQTQSATLYTSLSRTVHVK